MLISNTIISKQGDDEFFRFTIKDGDLDDLIFADEDEDAVSEK